MSVTSHISNSATEIKTDRWCLSIPIAEGSPAIQADIGDDRRLGRVYAHLVNYYYLRGQPAAAIAYGHRYVDVVRPTGDLALQGLGRQ